MNLWSNQLDEDKKIYSFFRFFFIPPYSFIFASARLLPLASPSFSQSEMRALRHGAHAPVSARQPALGRRGPSTSRSSSSPSSPVVAVLASSAATTTEAPPSAAGISPPAVGSHFLHVDDWSREKLDAVLATAQEVKAIFKSKDAQDFKPLAGKTMAMIFTKPSMRTRVSFETVCVCSSEEGFEFDFF